MVAGRLYYRRAASLPPSDYRLPVETNVGSKAYMISSHAVADNDAMRARSRRNDSNFLHDVSSKMAFAQLGHPYVGNSTYVANRYAPITHGYSYTAHPYTTYPSHVYYPSDYRRKTWYAPPVTDYEVDSYLAGGPSHYYSRFSRAGSVPPALPSSAYVPKWHSYGRGTSVVPNYGRRSVAPHNDVVVGVAHTAQYGDIVIGIPQDKKHLFQTNNNHYKGGNNYKSYYYPSFANRHSIAPSYAPSVGTVSVTPAYRRASIAVPYRGVYDSGLDVSPTSYSYYSGTSAPTTSVAALRGRAQSVQKQLAGTPQFQFFDSVAPAGVSVSGFGSHSTFSTAKTVPEPYTSVRPRAASSIPTFRAAGSSVKSSPSVPAASTGYSGGSYGGGSSSGALPAPGKYTKPPISDTRRKVRDLLCKSKKDPHYFD